MSNQEQNQNKDNSGVLFKNANKTSDKQPDYTGTVTVNGKELRIAAWENESKDKKTKFLKLSVSDPDSFNKNQQSTQTQTNTQTNNQSSSGNNQYGDIFDNF